MFSTIPDNLHKFCADLRRHFKFTDCEWSTALMAACWWHLKPKSPSSVEETSPLKRNRRSQTSLHLKYLEGHQIFIQAWTNIPWEGDDEWNLIMNTFWQIIMMMLGGWCYSCGSSNENESHYYRSECLGALSGDKRKRAGFRWGDLCQI